MGSGDCAGEHQDRLTIITDKSDAAAAPSHKLAAQQLLNRPRRAHDTEPNS
jgi:hypothetical protein